MSVRQDFASEKPESLNTQEEFRKCASKILAHLGQYFPVPRALNSNDFADVIKFNGDDLGTWKFAVANATLHYLKEEGYITFTQSEGRDFVGVRLTEKGFTKLSSNTF